MRKVSLYLLSLTAISLTLTCSLWAAEPKVEIHSPTDGARIAQDKDTILVSGRVTSDKTKAANVDILFVVDVSGSTAHHAGVDFGDEESVPPGTAGRSQPQMGIPGGIFGLGRPSGLNPRNSILAAEVAAARRLLSQLNPEATRAGLVTFGQEARILQPLTQDFDRVRQALDDVLVEGPYGGTHMVGGIRLAIRELTGFGLSEKKTDAVKVQFLLTDGVPTLPIGRAREPHPEDANLAIEAARIAGKAGIKIHVFALGDEALSYPRAAVGIARASGGIFTPVVRPADILGVLENVSVVGVDYVQVRNETSAQKASHLRLAADGFFSAAVPVVEGSNRIEVFARAGDGTSGRTSVTIHYQRGDRRSVEVEVFLEKEKSLKLGLEKLGKSREEIEGEIERLRKEGMGRTRDSPR